MVMLKQWQFIKETECAIFTLCCMHKVKKSEVDRLIILEVRTRSFYVLLMVLYLLEGNSLLKDS